MDIEMLRRRADIIRRVRAFFDRAGYLEADTPLLAANLIPETCLEVFATLRRYPAWSGEAPREMYLIPSPEIFLKRLIARHRCNIYEMCHCFRNGEEQGRTHSGEFTMLEYYTMDADYKDSIALTEHLFDSLLDDEVPPNLRSRLEPPFVRMTMDEAFRRHAGFSLAEALDSAAPAETLRAEARRLGLQTEDDCSAATLYDLIFVHAVESALDKSRPLVLLDYPAIVPCLAALNGEEGSAAATRQRWELYTGGVELANCYSEETDAETVRRYFTEEGRAKEEAALVKHAVDEDYWKNFRDFPRCSGVAMGVDRLVMAFTGRTSIESVLPF